jgi:hypothetical protein
MNRATTLLASEKSVSDTKRQSKRVTRYSPDEHDSKPKNGCAMPKPQKLSNLDHAFEFKLRGVTESAEGNTYSEYVVSDKPTTLDDKESAGTPPFVPKESEVSVQTPPLDMKETVALAQTPPLIPKEAADKEPNVPLKVHIKKSTTQHQSSAPVMNAIASPLLHIADHPTDDDKDSNVFAIFLLVRKIIASNCLKIIFIIEWH